MKIRRTRSIIVTLVLLAVGQSAAGSASFSNVDLTIGRSSYDEVGKGVVNSTGRHQTVRRTAEPGENAYFYVSVRKPDSTKTFRFSGTGSDDRFTVSYFNSETGEDITDDIVGGAYTTVVGPEEGARIWFVVTPAGSVETGDHKDVLVQAVDTSDETQTDIVRGLVRVPPIKVWAVNYRGTFRCTAIFPRRTVTPGDETGAIFKLTNLSDRSRDAYAKGHLVFESSEGQELWDTIPDWSHGPIAVSPKLDPKETARIPSEDARIRWSGPLVVTPLCTGLNLEMPDVELRVSQPGAPSSEAQAIDRAVDVPGSPFQQCRPGPNGQPNTGTLMPPDGRDLPPMDVRCWADVRHEAGFDVVALNMIHPQDSADYVVDESLDGESLPGEGNLYAARWGFVVTDTSVRPYISLGAARATSGVIGSYQYTLRDGEWRDSGWSTCGFEGFWIDPNGNSFMLNWVPGCGG